MRFSKNICKCTAVYTIVKFEYFVVISVEYIYEKGFLVSSLSNALGVIKTGPRKSGTRGKFYNNNRFMFV